MKTRVGEQGMRLLSFCITALATLTGVAEANPYRAADYAEFRRELRAFYPDECHGICKDPRQTNSVAAIGRDLDACGLEGSEPIDAVICFALIQ